MHETPLLLKTFNDSHRGRAGHINIQHYAQLIADASKAFVEELGLNSQQLWITQDERVRFLAELHSGDEVMVFCRNQQLAPQGLQLSGEIRRTSDAKTVCVFQRTLATWANWEKQTIPAEGWGQLPSAPSPRVESDISEIAVDFRGEVLNVFHSLDDSKEADEHGVMTARALWHVITEALWATQSKLGADQATLKQKNITGGATVFQLKHSKPIGQGTPLAVATSVIGQSESSIRMMHEVGNSAPNAEPLLTALYVVTFFDRERGQRCPLSRVFPGRIFGSSN